MTKRRALLRFPRKLRAYLRHEASLGPTRRDGTDPWKSHQSTLGALAGAAPVTVARSLARLAPAERSWIRRRQSLAVSPENMSPLPFAMADSRQAGTTPQMLMCFSHGHDTARPPPCSTRGPKDPSFESPTRRLSEIAVLARRSISVS